MTLKWIESHCHLDFPEFDTDRSQVIEHCVALGIEHLVVPGVEPQQWQRMIKMANQFPSFYFSVGLHPVWIDHFKKHSPLSQHDFLTELQTATQHTKCVAIGECGLDGMIDYPMREQIEWLNVQLNTACDLNLPLIIHMRRSFNELLVELKKFHLPKGGIIHAFSGSYEMGMQLIEQGFYLGVGGTITYERANKTRNAIRDIPLEHLVLETDSPDMPLQGFQGQRNSPEKILAVAECLAELKEERLEKISVQTSENAKNLFGF